MITDINKMDLFGFLMTGIGNLTWVHTSTQSNSGIHLPSLSFWECECACHLCACAEEVHDGWVEPPVAATTGSNWVEPVESDHCHTPFAALEIVQRMSE